MGKNMDYKLGIDIQEKQGTLSDAQKSAILETSEFVVHRFGYRGYGTGAIKQDAQLDKNVAWMNLVGIPWEIYFFTQAINEPEGIQEADAVAAHCNIKNRYVWCDTELAHNGTGRADNISKAARSAAILAFCKRVEQLGGKAGIYASTAWINERLDMNMLSGIPLWVADYRGYCGYTTNRVMWQFQSKNAMNVSGFATLDCNKRYMEIPAVAPSATTNTPYKTFVMGVQAACGATVDGIAGPKTLAQTVTVSCTKNRKHKVVRAVQVYLNACGYDCGTADGIAGAKFDSAVKNFQRANGCVVDGEITAKGRTWQKLLKLA